ncbi:MAG: DMT family transporter [Phycisphaeraceae bacterium]|nr:DMT family transporter [Phycisphaeraceae bacterium]
MPSLEAIYGPMAAVTCSALWAITSIFFTEAGRRIGVTRVNLWRLWIAFGFHILVFALIHGLSFPQIHQRQLAYLAISGVIGFAICDQALFLAFVLIGPRRTLLIQLSTPIFAVLLGVLVASEHLSLAAYLGIALVVAGIAWTVLERRPTLVDATAQSRTRLRLGVACAVLGAFTQALGLLLAKLGMSAEGLEGIAPIDPQTSALIRLPFGAFATLFVYLAVRQVRRGQLGATLLDPRTVRIGLIFAAAGAATGPFLGVWCAQIAITHLELGIAQTLLSLAPVFVIPIVIFAYREQVSRRALLGALVAFLGAVVLFLG